MRVRHARRLETIESLEQRERFFGRGAVLDRRATAAARGLGVAALEGRRAGVKQFLAFALPLGDGAARALDVRARAGMAAIEEEHSRPDVDRELVLTGEVVIEPAQQQFLEARLAIVLRIRRAGGRRSVVLIGCHELAFHAQSHAIMSRTAHANKHLHQRPVASDAVDRCGRRW